MKRPFTAKGDVELNKRFDEFIVRIGGFRKNMMLPREAASVKWVKAKLEAEQLSIFFKGEDHGQKK
jgi:arsenite-transporting ATPase